MSKSTPPPDVLYGTVATVERLTPSLVRIVFGGEGLAAFEPTEFTDQYVNALFVPDGATYAVPFDVDAARQGPADHRPRGRRYTVRAWDPQTRLLTVDFVAHGDTGYAGPWAQRARVGDRLQMVGPSGGYRPRPAGWHLMVGDESALPAIAASVEALAEGQRAVVVLVVDGPDDEVEVRSPAHLDVRWCHRRGSDAPDTLLLDTIASLEWPAGTVDVFVHGEAAEVRAVRRFLVAERGVDPAAASISPYWRRGHNDEAWREVKRDWLEAQAADV
ncbi:MAG: siderophore-interacting protein [Desertimonas sp.]